MPDSPWCYLDHAATTPLRECAAAAMADAPWANPSSLHAPGRRARALVEDARERIAHALGARPGQVVFTSGATEADNLAVKGLAWAGAAGGRRRLVVGATEHHAVADPARWLASRGEVDLVEIGVDASGLLDVRALEEELARPGPAPALVSVHWANNEVGAVQPLDRIVAAARRRGVPVHSDAAQAVGRLDVDFAASGLGAMSVTGHKLGGPVGVGALVLAEDLTPVPVEHGGGQERGLRSGTLDARAILGLAAALTEAVAERRATAARLEALTRDLLAGMRRAAPDVVLNGPPPGPDRLPGLLHVSVPACESEVLLYLLDAHGVAASAASACRAGVHRPSHVLAAMGAPHAGGALRLSLGWTSTADDVARLLAAWPEVVDQARTAAAATADPGPDPSTAPGPKATHPAPDSAAGGIPTDPAAGDIPVTAGPAPAPFVQGDRS